jgi:hypothetical protein
MKINHLGVNPHPLGLLDRYWPKNLVHLVGRSRFCVSGSMGVVFLCRSHGSVAEQLLDCLVRDSGHLEDCGSRMAQLVEAFLRKMGPRDEVWRERLAAEKQSGMSVSSSAGSRLFTSRRPDRLNLY